MDKQPVLMYSTGIEYPEINYNGKEYKKCVELSHFAIQLRGYNIVNQLYFNKNVKYFISGHSVQCTIFCECQGLL